MQALQLVAPLQPPKLREVPVPEPGPGQVLVKVGGAGACHSDLHLMEAPPERLGPLPFTLGHENAGWVENSAPAQPGRARRPRYRLRPLGLRNVRELPPGHGELLRGHGGPRWRAGRE